MTREEAIAILTDKIKPCLTLTDWEVAIDMAIEALSKPTGCHQIEDNSDLINRADAIDAIIAEGRTVDSRYLESERIVHECDAVEALAMLPSARPTDGDLISRADAIKRFCEFGTSLEWQGKTMITMVDAKYAFIEILESLPSADITSTEECIMCQEATERVLLNKASAARPTGEWLGDDADIVIPNKDGEVPRSCWCSECGEWLVASDEYAVKGNFCPNCGADMRGTESEVEE